MLQKLDQLTQSPVFCNYLAYILSRLRNAEDATRSLSGLILKNTIRAFWAGLPGEVQEFVRAECLRAIGDGSALIRATCGIIVTNIVVVEAGVGRWPALLPALCAAIDSGEALLVDGGFGALSKVTLSLSLSLPPGIRAESERQRKKR